MTMTMTLDVKPTHYGQSAKKSQAKIWEIAKRHNDASVLVNGALTVKVRRPSTTDITTACKGQNVKQVITTQDVQQKRKLIQEKKLKEAIKL